MGGRAPGCGRGTRWGWTIGRGTACRAAKNAKGALSQLKEALKDSAAPERAWDAAEAARLPRGVSRLQQSWSAADAQRAARVDKPDTGIKILGKGIRRLPDAIEYDFSLMDDSDIEDDGVTNPSGKLLPREISCFDTAGINVRSGDGGKGCCAFLREKFKPNGGPSGGNGGDGGSIWMQADDGLNSLSRFRTNIHWKGDAGVPGQGKGQGGANAKDLVIKVPPGTIVRERGRDEADEGGNDAPTVAELLKHGDRALIVQGGRGGRGNASFKSGRNNAPVISEDGEEGCEKWLDLELKLLADVGIIGVPNAGKSTLLSVLSSAKPKIADYAFTTLVPNLGVCEFDYQTTVFADVPGLIEGAHSGEGLGHEFLRHVSRARTLVHVVDGTARDALYDYKAIRLELQLYGVGLTEMPELIAYNKVDVPDSGDYVDDMRELLAAECGVDPANVVPISAVTGEGVVELVRRVRAMLAELPDTPPALATDAANVQQKPKLARITDRLADFEIDADLEGAERVWIVSGEGLEKFAQMTNFDYFEATLRFQRALQAVGLWQTLERRGVQEGDTVVIGASEFLWRNDRSDGKLYEAWLNGVSNNGKQARGAARWPHMAG